MFVVSLVLEHLETAPLNETKTCSIKLIKTDSLKTSRGKNMIMSPKPTKMQETPYRENIIIFSTSAFTWHCLG